MRLGLVCDLSEEQWPSMDLCAEMLLSYLPDASCQTERLCPSFHRFFAKVPLIARRGSAANGDRFLNRFVHYPRFLKRHLNRFAVFHIVDHSYAQLVHVLPPGRSGVYCHDLDAFRCLFEPARDRRPRWFRALARRVLTGLQKAAVVFHSTRCIRADIERYGLVDPARLVHAPYGVAPEFTPDGPSANEPTPFLLHVGSNVPRKRIDVLLRTLAGVRRHFPSVRLLKVGGPFTPEQQRLIAELKLDDAITRREGLSRGEIAALCRNALAMLLPSDAEGFGLPLVEALACGTAVLASDLPVLREVGRDAAVYVPVGDIEAWTDAVGRALARPHELPARSRRLEWASRFSWVNHAGTLRGAYMKLLS